LEATKGELEALIAEQFMEISRDKTEKARSRAELFLRVIDERAGLLVERAAGVYAFAHLTFQEYLAARGIADREDYIAYTLRRLHDLWWREVILLEVGHLSTPNTRRSRALTTDLLNAIRNAHSPLESILKPDLLLTCRALADVGALGVDDSLRRDLMAELFTLWRTTPYRPQEKEIVDVLSYSMPTPAGPRIREELLRLFAEENRKLRDRAGRALQHKGLLESREII